MAQAYLDWLERYRWAVIFACLLVVVLAGLGLPHLRFSADYKVYFGEHNPERTTYEAFEAVYSGTDNMLIGVTPRNAPDIFNPRTLRLLQELTTAAWQVPFTLRVDSIVNFQHMEASGDDLVVEALAEQDVSTLTPADLARMKAVATSQPALVNRLISPDGRTTGVAMTLNFPGTDHTDQLPQSVESAHQLAERLSAAYPDHHIVVSGVAEFSYTEVAVSQQDLRTLTPVMLGTMIVLLFLFLRSFNGTLVTVMIVVLSATIAMGIAGWLGIKITASSALAPTIILTLAVANTVHILYTVFDQMGEGLSQRDALVQSLHLNTEPVSLSSLTTGVGFLSLNFADAPPFHDLGNMSAMGVAAAWALSMALTPVLILLLPLRKPSARVVTHNPMRWFGSFIVRRRLPVLWSTLAVAALLSAFIPRLQLDDQFIKWFDPDLPFRINSDYITENLTGPYSIEYSLRAREDGGITNPDYLANLEKFVQWARQQPDVVHVDAFSFIMQRLNQAMHGDDPAWYTLPKDPELAAQYLLLYELSLPYGLDLNRQMNSAKSATRFTVTLGTVPRSRILDFVDQADAWMRANLPSHMQAQATGTVMMFARLAERNIRTMLRGTALAFVLISITLILTLRSFRIGIISLIPNSLPILMTFGFWSLTVGEIGILASIITATSLGLIVDDTVHILSKYHRAKLDHHLNTHDSIRYTFTHVGKALWVTTTVLACGFFVLTLSDFKLNSDLGLLTAMTLAFALVLDFLLLPPLLMWLDREKHCRCEFCQCAHAATT